MPTVKALALLRLQMMRWQLKLYRELCNSFRFSWARLRNFKLTAVLSCRRHIQTPKPPAPALPHHQPAPLRILFCGSDHFSVPCLRALAEECSKNPRVIESIHVACRPPKRTGRGLQVMRELPIQQEAKILGLPVTHVDCAEHLESQFGAVRSQSAARVRVNLIVAVSFGLLIPPSVINASTFGGLNVHPSLLPDLAGAAPLHHTLLCSRSHTGVTLQTLHPTRFDAGSIISQTPLPGIPVPAECDPAALSALLAPIGASMLLQALQARKFVFTGYGGPRPPIDIDRITGGKGLAFAPKIHKADMQIKWLKMEAREVLLRLRVYKRVWDRIAVSRSGKCRSQDSETRVTFHELLDATDTSWAQTFGSTSCIGVPFVAPIDPLPWSRESGEIVPHIGIRTVDGRILEVKACTVSGRPSGAASVKELARLVKQQSSH